jgi:dual specificity MAP kinase phosphatase
MIVYWERLEMMNMSASSEISPNVFLGPTPDPSLESTMQNAADFNVMIEASDMAQIPPNRTLEDLRKRSERMKITLEFPSSGSIMPPTWSHSEVDGLMSVCAWIYSLANPESEQSDCEASDHDDHVDGDGDSVMTGARTPPSHSSAKRVLIHCSDGYTESSLLALAYFMYAEGLPVHDAWIQLHKQRGRNFFAYASDVALLNSIQQRILAESPKNRGLNMLSTANAKLMAQKSKTPSWLNQLDGSLPSRILPYMYLGNLNHANNPQLLRKLGITRILSVGEALAWAPEDVAGDKPDKNGKGWKQSDLMYIDDVQDNGVDPLTGDFEKCLKFVGKHSPSAFQLTQT